MSRLQGQLNWSSLLRCHNINQTTPLTSLSCCSIHKRWICNHKSSTSWARQFSYGACTGWWWFHWVLRHPQGASEKVGWNSWAQTSVCTFLGLFLFFWHSHVGKVRWISCQIYLHGRVLRACTRSNPPYLEFNTDGWDQQGQIRVRGDGLWN